MNEEKNKITETRTGQHFPEDGHAPKLTTTDSSAHVQPELNFLFSDLNTVIDY